ncbi:phage portal protein [Acetobacter musti]|uniref:Phage portal protein n=1 Tax=Acetobacter musti TaxID=864732 RepID=A0ABX0JK84_9PROT|nr:phage portal protein [Acetobacter musti]NHN83657.1 phage portal protein [Acetobacter musti]
MAGLLTRIAGALRGENARHRADRIAPAPPDPRRAHALNAPFQVPFDAADNWGQHLAAWQPFLYSADTEINPYRDQIVSRVRDLVRNDGWASGAITRTLDNAVGVNLRPVAKPDYRALAELSGNKAFDAHWAREFGAALDARWRLWANCPDNWNDAERMLSFGQQMHLAFRHLLIDGDALAILPWDEASVGYGRARYATTVQIIDPDRLSNPNMMMDLRFVRGGVEINDRGVPQAYFIRKAHQADWYNAAQSVEWERIPRETSWGRRQVVHMFEHHRAAQHRGGAGMLTPVVQRLKMLIKYDGSELDAAIINSVFAAYIESPFDHQMTAEALDPGMPNQNMFGARWGQQLEWNHGRNLSIQGSRIPMLFPGEKVSTVSAARPTSNFHDFEKAVLNNVATGAGMASFQLSNDWSDVNYSSARGALLESWKTLTRRREDFQIGFVSPIRTALIEEMMEVDDLPLPRDAPDFVEAKYAYARCRWLAPGRGWIDPVAEKQGAILGMDAGLSTLEAECAINEGADWEEHLDQRSIEVGAFKERGLPLPEWSGGEPASKTKDKPEEE